MQHGIIGNNLKGQGFNIGKGSKLYGLIGLDLENVRQLLIFLTDPFKIF